MKQKFIPGTGKVQMSKKKKTIINKINFKNCKICKRLKKISFKKENLKLTPKKIYILLIVFLVIFLFLIRSAIFAAFVNGKPIFRLSVVSIAEKQDGSTILDNLIEKKLIFSEAKKQNVKITEEEIDTEVKNIEEVLKQQNITLDQALELSNQDMKNLKEQIKIQKIAEQILGKNIEILEEEISDYYTTNKDYFGSSKLEDVKEEIKDELYNQKLSTEYTTWIEELKVDAKIKYIVNY